MNGIPIDERLITDEQIFKALDLTYPGLEPVQASIKEQDIPAARKHLIHYLQQRTNVTFLFDYRSLPLTPIDTDSCPYSFQSSLGLSGSLKEFCLHAGRSMMEHRYVLPGAGRGEVFLGRDWEHMIHFQFPRDQGRKHRHQLDMFVRGQFFESLCILYHETGDPQVLAAFSEVLTVFLRTYPLQITDTAPDTNRFQYTEDRDVMSVGWLFFVYSSLFYTRVPYEIPTELAFELLKRIWFLGIQFQRFTKDHYRPYNHHMWERGLVPFFCGILFPEIPDFAAMKDHGAQVVSRHIKEDFHPSGGYSEHSIAYWSGAAVGEMLSRGVCLARLNREPLLDREAHDRLERTFHILAAISPPGERYPSLGDNAGPMAEPILNLGISMMNQGSCRAVLCLRRQQVPCTEPPPLSYCDNDAGFVCARSGYGPDATYLLLSAKVNSGCSGHNHMDMLSVFLTFRGQEFIGEPYAGTLYHTVRMGSRQRGFMYNMESHNTVLAYGKPITPNENYASKWGVFPPPCHVVSSRSYEDGFYVNAYHDGYTFCRHQRELLFHHRYGMMISDHIVRGNRLEDPHIQRWYLMPGTKLTLLDQSTLIMEKNQVTLLWMWMGAEHQIAVKTPRFLCPEPYASQEELCPYLDVSFQGPEHKKRDNITVSLHVLILDITAMALDHNPDSDARGQIRARAAALWGTLDKEQSLTDFPTLTSALSPSRKDFL